MASRWLSKSWPIVATVVALLSALSACGGGGDTTAVAVHILVPADSATYTTSETAVRLGGTIDRASFLHVDNLTTGTRSDGYVNYVDGRGSWMADVYGLVPGPNTLEAVADQDGTGRHVARDRIVVTRVVP